MRLPGELSGLGSRITPAPYCGGRSERAEVAGRLVLSDPVRTWRKSSASENTNCVEVCLSGDGVLVRDSKSPDGFLLSMGDTGWRNFLSAIRGDQAAFRMTRFPTPNQVLPATSLTGRAYSFSTSQKASR
ncbi:DUF397 domain-containing protein [Streptomyces sp. NPDC002962]|uniref:DUF397 domain-containing protein n=1 Tax=Streptomyces sp. NPDC002962 TaxID=3364674 RepID=UPI00368274A5